MKPSPLLPLALPSLVTASTINLTATLCPSTTNTDLTPFTITVPLNNLTPLINDLDSAICNLSITSASVDLDLSSVSCTVYAPALNVDLKNAPLPSILSFEHPIVNLRLGSALCSALPQTPHNRILQLARDIVHLNPPSKPRAADASAPTGKATGKNIGNKKDDKPKNPPVKERATNPTGDSGSEPRGKETDKKKVETREDEDSEDGDIVDKRGNSRAMYVGAAPSGARVEMGVFGVGVLAIGIATLVF